MPKYQEYGRYLVVDPEVCFGKLTFKGTRVPVQTVLRMVAKEDVDYALKNYPRVSREAVAEALEFAGAALVKLCRAAPTNGHLETSVPWEKRL